MLTQETQQEVNGQASTVSNVILKDCKIASAS